ncbi:thioesterase II family protein [Kitasatospora sp. NPDC008050]|uniref:thioesterase II family protein n=1 Tax=Kitasatospora sp. NPDC008050 TaxID=3364021 RepID=UPI0036DFC1BA
MRDPARRGRGRAAAEREAEAGGVQIAFPHAGGSATYFFPMAEALRRAARPLELDILSVQYPGRQERRPEPCVDDLQTLADLAVKELLQFTDRPLALFGHSMGAMVAFEVARRFEQQYGITLLTFFASGRGAPGTARQAGLHRLPDAPQEPGGAEPGPTPFGSGAVPSSAGSHTRPTI